MALDSRIISEAPDTGYKIQLPQEIRNQTIAADLTRKKLEQARDEAHQAAARRQAAQMSDGDPELYVKNLERAGLFEDAQKFATTIEDNRKKTLDALKTETETQETQIERSLTNAALVHDEPTYQAWRAQTVKMAPQYNQLLPPTYSEGLVPQLLEVGTKSREILKAQREAIEAGLKGDHIASLGGYLASLQTPQERAQALESAKTVLHYPEATVARFRGVDPNDPQYAEKVKALTLPLKSDEPVSLQSQNVMVNGKPAVVNFNPRTGTREVQEGVTPIPPRPLASSASAAGGQGGLTPDAVEMEAAKYRILGATSIPTRIEAADRLKIMNAAAAQSKVLGVTPVAGIQKQLATKGDQAALTLLKKMSSTAEASESKAIGQADIIDDLSKKVSRTSFPIINKSLLSAKKEILGDSDTTQLFNALTTFTSEYAKIIEGSTGSVAGSSDSARHATERIANAAMSQKTLSDVIALMKKEMRLAIQGYDAAEQHVLDKISSPLTGAAAAPAGNAKDPLDILGKP